MNYKRYIAIVLIVSLTLWILPHRTYASFTYSRSITVNAAQVPSTQSSFPMLVSGTYSYLATVANGGKVQNANGFDVGFYSNSTCTSKLNWETELYTATTGVVVYWVNVSSISDGTVIYLCYGDASISTDQSNATAVWDSNYKGVYHLKDGTTLSPNDSTSNANNGTPVNTPTATAGQIDGAGNFVAASSQSIGVGSAVVSTFPLTISGWFNTDASVQGTIASISGDASGHGRKLLYTTNVAALRLYSQNDAAGSANPNGGTFTINVWHYGVAVFAASNDYKIYLDAGTPGTDTTNVVFGTVSDTKIGWENTASNFFKGKIDEVRYSNIARSADWIKTEYNNQSSPSTFYTLGSESNLGAKNHKFIAMNDKFVFSGQNKYIFQ